MSDINSVTEGRVTVTANDTEENIRVAAGFPDAAEPDAPESKPAETETAKLARERDESGKFKTKAEADDAAAKPEAKPDKAGNPRTSYQAKINLLTAEREEAKRRADDLERRLSEREAEYQSRSQPAPVPLPQAAQPSATSKYLADVQRYQAEADAPKFDDFVAAGLDDPYTAHRDAMSMYIADRRHQEYRETESRRAQVNEVTSRVAQAMDIAAQTHPDFQAHLQAAESIRYQDAPYELLKREAVRDPSLSAELFHYLATHPDDASQLAAITDPIAAAREIGRLTAGLSSAPPGPETDLPRTMAKPLIKPVRPSVMARDDTNPDELPFSKYVQVMNEKDRKDKERRRA